MAGKSADLGHDLHQGLHILHYGALKLYKRRSALSSSVYSYIKYTVNISIQLRGNGEEQTHKQIVYNDISHIHN